MDYHTPAIKHSFYKLFSPQDRQTLAWGVGHYFDEDQQQRIDIDRSVAASANQGLPVIEFEPNRHEREVWLWQDRQNQSPLQTRLISEVTQLLKQANIHVKHGFFNGFPYQITNSDQSPQYQVMGALPQPAPLVMLCLDANNVNTCFSRYPIETEQAFQHLKQWSTLAIVDCNPTAGSLKQTLKDYRLPYLLPTQVADWFARQGEGNSHRKEYALNDVYRWACACALAQRIITEDEAYELHKALGLNCAWQYSHLSAYGQKVVSGLDFTTEQVTRINDLNDQDRTLAVQFWQQRFKQIDKDLALENDYPNWQNSYAQYKEVRLPIALLGLWGEPNTKPPDKAEAAKRAVDQLHDLFQRKDLQAPIKQHLGRYTCNGLDTEVESQNHVLLPYDWQQLNAQSQQQLLAMGFAGQVKELKLQLDKPSGVLMGALAGLMLFGLVQSIAVLWNKPPELRTHISSAAPLDAVQLVTGGTAYLGTPKHSLELSKGYKEPQDDKFSLEDNSIIDLTWSRKIVPAQETLISRSGATNEAQLWRLGTRRMPLPRPSIAKNQRIIASLAIITTKPDDMDAQALAAQLLDSGSADQVLITEKLGAYQKRFSNWSRFPDSDSSKHQVQRILIGKGATNHTGNLTGVPNTLVFDGGVDELLAKFNNAEAGKQSPEQLRDLDFVRSGNPYLLLMEQTPIAADTPITLEQGMKLMPIPAGQFEMGSSKGQDDEKPIHTVTISKSFWMSETEVTFEQYQTYTAAVNKPLPSDSGWGTGQRPVINVSWQEASDYTQWLSKTNTKGLSCRLPSEAKWEYAARAGTVTPFYWGEANSREFANTNGKEGRDQWGNETAPVKSFKPNQWGLYDMSGNVYEWTQDRYHESYEGAPTDGSAWDSGSGASRVLRGGSWSLASFNVRSANRDSFDGGSGYIGFRVICSPIGH